MGAIVTEVIQNLFRRRWRTIVTIIGIAVGVLALTVLGALAERMNMLVVSSTRFFTDHIHVLPGGQPNNTGLFLPTEIERVRQVDGVDSVQRRIDIPYTGVRGSIFGFPPTVYGVHIPTAESLFALPLQYGRHIHDGERGVIVVGADISLEGGWVIGDELPVHGRYFTVVGILQRTLGGLDSALFMSLDDAEEVLISSTPFLQQVVPLFDGGSHVGLATGLNVVWADGLDAAQLSADLQRALPDMTVLSPDMLRDMLSRSLTLVNMIVLGSGFIALLVGGLSVVNTMMMSVGERRTEISLKKALGASAADIMGEVVLESALIGLLGALLGLMLGFGLVAVFNTAGAQTHTQVFIITGRLAVFALVFGIGLGALGGLLPAAHAARMDPVIGLRGD